jgi:hypothetical protein
MSLGETVVFAKMSNLFRIFLICYFSHDAVPVRDGLTMLFLNRWEKGLAIAIGAGHEVIVGLRPNRGRRDAKLEIHPFS